MRAAVLSLLEPTASDLNFGILATHLNLEGRSIMLEDCRISEGRKKNKLKIYLFEALTMRDIRSIEAVVHDNLISAFSSAAWTMS
ncbi:hypothetical protein [Bradyrhizobium sp. LHD-71]|uniref:hypothetical protein n=1 Tax=Bradyrhizobium sp. LHD-71 TaxID=3072141 RepID=UPI0028108310|nr:hypothetical protein [Bradyrhizobium sp. LHD-71]MDQ8729150.1 hypothetical protein [Bradyrhizobium sp. LHD-71]